MIDRRIASGHLVRLHRGVYAVGHRHLRREGWWMAAVLAAGPKAALSHRDAAALHGLRPPGSHLRTEVTTTGRAASTDRIRIYRTSVLDEEDITTVNRIRVTSVARTLVDLAGTIGPHWLARALDEAERQHALDVHKLERALQRTDGRRGPGHKALREALAETGHAPQRTRSSLEDAFLKLVARAALPAPTANASIEGLEVDALWAREKVVVELDGYEFHRTRQAFQRDRTRANDLTLKGYTVLRFTYADVTRDRGQTVARLTQALRYPPPP